MRSHRTRDNLSCHEAGVPVAVVVFCVLSIEVYEVECSLLETLFLITKLLLLFVCLLACRRVLWILARGFGSGV